MYETVKKLYQYDSWPRPSDRSILLENFSLWPEALSDWMLTSLHVIIQSPISYLIRAVADHKSDKDSRLLIDVYVNPDLCNAYEDLLQLLAGDQLGLVPRGPDDLGNISFIHPEGLSPATYFVRGNICIAIINFGRKIIATIDLAYGIDRFISSKPAASRLVEAQVLTFTQSGPDDLFKITHTLPPLSKAGYYKFFSTGGELLFKGEELYFRAQQAGEAVIEAFALEPGQEAYAERLVLTVE